MAELYTSLVRAKQALAQGRCPPMTQLSEKALDVIDPDFTPGQGALEECADRGLRCPIRGCGRYFHSLGRHLDASHPDIGADGLRRILDIAPSAALMSRGLRGKRKRAGRRRPPPRVPKGKLGGGVSHKKTARARKRAAMSMGARNFRNNCDAQIAHRLWELRNRLNRTPRVRDAKQLDQGLHWACVTIYGSWNAAKAYHGLETLSGSGNKHQTKYDKSGVCDMIRAWVDEHGYLPASSDCGGVNGTPLIPTWHVIMRTMGAQTWDSAINGVRLLLGLPVGFPVGRRAHRRSAPEGI